ncbi:PAS domain-containing sensor histidine kinase [Rufibacter latericius]|nr:PAS domain S-box protein [Rufibacter latericius]
MNIQAPERVYKDFFEYAPQPGFILDHRNLLTEINRSARDLFGFSENEVLNTPWLKLVEAEEIHPATLWQDLQDKGQVQLQLQGIKKDGQRFLGNFSFTRVEDQEQVLVFCTIIPVVVSTLGGESDPSSGDLTENTWGNNPSQDKLTIQMLTRIYDNLSEVIFMFDVQGKGVYRFESVNSSFLKVTGLKKEQVVGQLVEDVIPEPSLTLVRSKYALAIRSGETIWWEEITPYPTGVKTGLVKVTPLYNEQRVCTKLLGSVTDITGIREAEKQLEISNERYALAAKATNDALYDWNITTDVMHWGEGFEKLFGFTQAEIKPNLAFWDSLLHPEDKAAVRESLANCLKDGTQNQWEMEYRLRRANGSYAYVVEQGFILRDVNKKATRMVGALKDLTARKEHEAERELLITHLTQRNTDLEQFSFITSHNLRAPVSNLLGLIDLLDSESAGKPQNRFVLDQIKESTHQLNHIVNDLSDILVLKSNLEVETQQVSIRETFQEVTQTIQHQLTKVAATVQTDFSGGEKICFSPDYLRSILLNLLSNSIKFRSPSRPLQVTLKTELTETGLNLYFTDNGQGIDLKRYGHKIFLYQRFQAKQDNKGIGLFMIQEQLKAMGGNISVQSEVDQGTTFILHFKAPVAT